MANPVQWQLQYKTTKQGSKWVTIVLTGNKRSVVISGLLSDQNYLWQLRAKCGNSWTSYPAAVAFTTLANGNSAREVVPVVIQTANDLNVSLKVNAKPVEPKGNREHAVLTVSPNPTTGLVNLDILTDQDKAVTAVISILDLKGIRLHTERTVLVNGSLHKTIQLPRKMTAGIYLVEIIVNNTSYTSRLVLKR
jgi:hypothetical protein